MNKTYEIIVGNIGNVYQGPSMTDALRTFDTYVLQSKHGNGRTAGEAVTMVYGGEPCREYVPTDFTVSGGGSVYLLTPTSAAGVEWATMHLPGDALKLGKGFAVEHRYLEDILDGICAEGLRVERS